jgi:glutamyl-tRNA synthetase
VKRGAAYRCPVTAEELAARRARADELKTELADPNLSPEQKASREKEREELLRPFRSPWRDPAKPLPEGKATVVRLRMPDAGDLTVPDRVQGPVTQRYRDLDDLVLLRSDGTPTYLLAVVVDDHDMGVTHVIRGDDHLTNTFRQIPIIDGMGWKRPEYAHVPMIHGPDGKKLSKRHGATGVESYRDELGYLPEGLKNYLLRLGWSHGDAEIISEDQAISWFDLDGLNKAPARLDMKKLDAVNGHYMAQAGDQRLFDLFAARPEASGLSAEVLGRIRAAISVLKTRSPNLVALADQARFLTDLRPITLSGKQADQLNEEARVRLSGLLPRLENLPEWTEPAVKEGLTQYCAELGIGLGKIGPVLRAVLTGGAPAPDITLVLALLGRNESLARIRDYAPAGG